VEQELGDVGALLAKTAVARARQTYASEPEAISYLSGYFKEKEFSAIEAEIRNLVHSSWYQTPLNHRTTSQDARNKPGVSKIVRRYCRTSHQDF
jgi:hypothetical protein